MRYRILLILLALGVACGVGPKPGSLVRYNTSSPVDVTYSGAGTDLAPPTTGASAAVTPKITADQAWQAYKKSGVFPGVASQAAGSPDVSLVSFSDNEQGDVQADGSIKLKFQHVLSWAIVFHGVPWTGIGGPPPASGSQTVATAAVPEDIVIIIDANSGQLVSAFADVPGAAVAPTPVSSDKGLPLQSPSQAPTR